jgi:hypothetical protein
MSKVHKEPLNTWLGTKKGANQVENESQHANFFTNTDVLTGQSILIRESIQNAIDARDKASGQSKAKVRFYVGSVSTEVGKKYFKEQYARIEKCLKNVPSLEEDCRFIAVEDFNTTGLVGSVKNDLPEGDSRIGSFFYFTWATGKSNKSVGTRGKNGVGKIVFPKTSKIKSFLVFSSRDNDLVPDEPKNLLFGTSILKTHELDGVKWLPESHWMCVDETASEPMHVPSSNEDSISEFIKDWKLERQLNQKGTSIVIPYRDENFSGKNLAQCIAQDYFVAILEGILEVEVVDESGFEVTMNSSNVTENLEALDETLMTKTSKNKEELLALCKLFTARQTKATSMINSSGTTKGRNYWEEHKFDESERDSMREKLDLGITLEFRVSTFVPAISDGTPFAEDFFSVLVSKKEGSNLPSTFAREGIIIPSANITRIDGFTTLVVIDSGRLADLLGDAEGPSHEKWSWEEEKFQGKYSPKIAGEETIKFLRQAVVTLLRKIQVQINELEDSRYANAFPLPSDLGLRPIQGGENATPSGSVKKVKKKGKRIGGGRTIKPVLVSENFEVINTNAGFVIKPSGISTLTLGNKFEVKAGYDLSTGNPLVKSAVDFEIAHRLTKNNGVTIVSSDGNFITFAVDKLPFECAFDGFHTYRDVVVAVNDVN